jgi:hypothetical protein
MTTSTRSARGKEVLVTSKRAIEEGLLPPVRLSAHGVSDLAEENANFGAGFFDVAEQGFAEGAVAARGPSSAVVSCLAE